MASSLRSTLRQILVPTLRARGFEGDLPHLRRVTPEGTSLFTIQTSKKGGAFIVELGRVPPGPYATVADRVIAPNALTTPDLRLAQRARLCAVPDVEEEVWFRYRPTRIERMSAAVARVLRRPARTEGDAFERAARAVVELLPECDRWWAGGGTDDLPHVRGYP